MPQIEANIPRGKTLVLAIKVSIVCLDLKNLLSESNVVREGSFYTAFKSRTEYEAIIDKIDELQNAAKALSLQTTDRFPRS